MLDTYAELKDQVAKLLNKTNLTDQIPVFIRLFEAQASRRLRHYKMQAVETFTLNGRTRPLPCNFRGVESFRVGKYAVTYVTPDQMDDVRDADGPHNGQPLYYTIVGEQFLFSPGAGPEECVVRYWTTLCPLSDRNKSNWLLCDSPDIYLYGAALQAAPYLLDDDRIAVWQSFVESAYATLQSDSIESQFGAHAEVQVRSLA